VWTSTLHRTVETARFLPYKQKQWKELDEIDAGLCEGMTYEEVAAKYPADFAARKADKLNYRLVRPRSCSTPPVLLLASERGVFRVCQSCGSNTKKRDVSAFAFRLPLHDN
jgi:hypothetical protein